MQAVHELGGTTHSYGCHPLTHALLPPPTHSRTDRTQPNTKVEKADPYMWTEPLFWNDSLDTTKDRAAAQQLKGTPHSLELSTPTPP